MDQKILQSTKWSGITELFSKLAMPLTNIFLARILTPEVFGIVATFTMITSFVEVFTDAGFQKYLVQHEFQNEKDQKLSTNVAFWTNFILSGLVWLCIYLFRDQLAVLVGSEGYGTEIAVMSLCIPLVALSSIQLAIFRRNFQFKELLPIRMIVCAVPMVVTVPLALLMRNCWALIIGAICKELLNAILLTWRSLWKPSLEYSFAKLREMLSFSMMILLDSFMIWLTSYAGTFIISVYLNDYYTGLYKTGITTISTYINLLYTITSPVLYAALSRMQNNRKGCLDTYFKFQHYTAFLALPLGIGIFVFRDFVTQILLGNQWSEASLLLGGMAAALALSSITAQYNSDFFRSQGKPHVALIVQTIYVIVMVIVLYLAVQSSFAVVCMGRIAVAFAYPVISCVALSLAFHVSFKKIIRSIYWPALSAIIMGVGGFMLLKINEGIVWNIISVLICIAIYGLMMLIHPQIRKEVFNLKSKQK